MRIVFNAVPASGYRPSDNGSFKVVGLNYYYRSASSAYKGNRNAANLSGGMGGVYPLANDDRAFGFSVRCVQEEIK